MREVLLERTLGDLILLSSGAEFHHDPAAFGTARGLQPKDAETLARQKDRFLLYRELARNNLLAPLENAFPVLQALLGPEAWAQATAAFLAARTLQSNYYRDIAPAFAAWLAETGWGRDCWPAILELAHYEYLELLVTRWPEEEVAEDLSCEPSPGACLALDPAARVVSYGFAVHRATESEPDPSAEAAHLLLYRDGEGGFGVLELTATTAALLARAQSEPLGQVLSALGLAEDRTLRDLLADLQERGALLGYRN
jgi:hypothetical protein